MVVSIIVPVYNVKKHLERCINSLVGQTYKNVEILLIDDGSTDESGKICDLFAKNYENVKVEHKINGGVSSARNLGLEKADGDFILFVDSDDWLETNTVEELVGVAIKHNSDIVMFEYFVDDKNSSVPYVHTQLNGKMTKNNAFYHTVMPTNRFAVTKMYRKSLVQQSRFNENIHLGEDTLFACSAIAQAKDVYFLAKTLYHYVQSEQSATRKVGFNKKLLTGKDAYYKIIEIAKGFSIEMENVAKINCVEILIWIISEMYKEKSLYREEIRCFQSEIKKLSKDIKKCAEFTLKKRLKIFLCSISPALFAKRGKK